MPGVCRIMHWLRVIAALVLGAATVSDAATTILAGCVTGTSAPSFTPPSDGGEYEALGCRFDAYITLNSPASLAVTNSSSVLVSGGSATAGYGIEVAFPATYSQAQLMGALHYTVRDVALGDNAMLVFSGTMPANSSVVLSNNTFSITARNPLHAEGSYLGTSSLAIAIRIGAVGGSLQLNNSRFLVINNVAVADVGALNLGMVFIALSTVQLTQGSSVAFDDNIIRDSSSNHDICTVLWSPPTASPASLVINGSSSFSVSRNRVYASQAQWSVYVVRVFSDALNVRMAVDILQASSLTVSSNSIQSSHVDANANAVVWGWRNVSVTEYSIVSFNDNYIWNLTAGTRVRVVFWQISDVYISNNSRISLGNNSASNIKATGGTLFQAVIMSSETEVRLSVSDCSSVSFNNNIVSDSTSTGNSFAVVLTSLNSISVRMGSLLSFSNNTLRAAVVAAIAVAVYLNISTGTGFTFPVSNSSRVQLDGNIMSSVTANWAAVVYWYSRVPFNFTVDQGSYASVNLNTASSVTANIGFQSVFYWYGEGASSTVSISVSRYSTFSMSNNSGNRLCSRDVTAAVWWLFLAIDTVSISLDLGSTMAVSDNSILDTSCPLNNLRVIAFDFSSSKRLNISVHDRSCLATNSNLMRNASALAYLLVVHWIIAHLSTSTIAVSNNSTMSFSNNVASGVNSSDNMHAVFLMLTDGDRSIIIREGSMLAIDCNSIVRSQSARIVGVVGWGSDLTNRMLIDLANNSTLSMSNNSGNRSCGVDLTVAVLWSFSSIDTVSISLDLGSTMAVSDNSILDTTSPTGKLRVAYFGYSSSKRLNISVHDRSSLTVNGNVMRNTSALVDLLVVHWYMIFLTSTFAISNHSSMSFGNNVASGVSSGDNMHGVYIDLPNGDRTLIIREGSILAMHCNSIVRSRSTGVVMVAGWGSSQTNRTLIDLSNNSTISMSHNFLRNHTSELGARLVQLSFSNTDATVQFPKLFILTNNSHIVIQNNSAYATRSKGNFVAVNWVCKTLFTLQFVLIGESSITVSGNQLLNCSATIITSVLLFSFADVKTFQFSINHSSLSFSNNSIYNTTSQGSSVSVQWNQTAAAMTMTLANGSLVSFSGNTVINSTSADFTSVVKCSFPPSASISIWGSTWRMTSNKYIGDPPTTLASVATIAVLCAGCRLLSVDSAIQIEGNTLKSSSTTSVAVSLVELQCTLSLEGESKLSIRDNEYFMVPSSGSKPGLLLGNLYLADAAAVDMSHNAFTATATGPCPPPMARIEGISSSMPQRSSVAISSNALSFNTSVPSSLACPCLSIGSLASGLTVHSNTVSSNASNTTLVAVGAMSVPTPGIVKIAENSLRLDAPAGSLLAVSGYLTLEGRSGISVVDNRVTRLAAFAITAPLYYLVAANALNMSASQTALTVCGNIVYGDGSSSFKPDRFLMPLSMVNITKRCSVSSSGSHSQSASESRSITSQLAATDTESSVASQSLTGMVTSSKSMSNALPITGSRTTPLTASATFERPPTSSISSTVYATLSDTLKDTATLTLSHSCQNLTDVNVKDTCEVLRLAEWLPPAGSEYPVAASLVFGAGDCTSLKIPYSAWTGRRGSSHHLRIIATDPRVPIYKGTKLPNPVPDSTLFASVASETTEDLTFNFTNESDVAAARTRGLIPSGVGGNLTVRFQVGLATVTYLGSSTLNQLKYRLDCGSWPRCPIPMPSAFEVTLLASDKVFPVALSETVTVGSVIASIGGGVTVSPSVVAQLGVLSSLRQMSRCYSPDPDDEEASGYDQYTKGTTLNPFGISIGEGGGARRYVRGSLVMSVVYALCLSALMFTYTTASSRISHHFHAKAGAPRSLLIGYPSALVAVGSFVMDGAASAGIVLGVQGATAGDWVVGWLFVLLCLVFVGQIILATVRWLPPSLVAEPHLPEVAFRARSMLKWLGSATHKWAGTDSDVAAAQWMRRYEGYVADLKVPWYGGLEQGVALALYILAAIPIGEPVLCVARGAVCTLLVAVQATVMVVLRPMVHRWRWLLMSTVLVLQTIVASLSIANAQLQEQLIELAMDAIGAIVFVLLIAAFVLDVLMMLRELWKAAAKRSARARWVGRTRAEDVQDSEGHMLPDIAEPLITSPCVATESSSVEVESESPPPPVDLRATDSDIVRQILEQLRDYELAKELL